MSFQKWVKMENEMQNQNTMTPLQQQQTRLKTCQTIYFLNVVTFITLHTSSSSSSSNSDSELRIMNHGWVGQWATRRTD